MIHLPRFLCFCNYCCFAGIVAEANCTPTHCRGNVCLPSVRVCNAPYNFQSRFCNRPMISCSIHGVDELYSCKESLHNSTFLVEQSACGLRIARISPNLKIWSFCGKGNATNPHTWILLPMKFWDFVNSSVLNTGIIISYPNTLLSLLHCDVYHGAEVDILEDESLE